MSSTPVCINFCLGEVCSGIQECNCGCRSCAGQGWGCGNCAPSCCTSTPVNNTFVLVRLVAPNYKGMLYDQRVGKYYPNGQTFRLDFDSNGCLTTCDLTTNDCITPQTVDGDPATYYEFAIIVDGCEVSREKVVLDARNTAYPVPPDCVSLADVTLTSPEIPGSPYICSVVKSCETPFESVSGPGISVLPGDHPDGAGGNGHQPTITLNISSEPGNAASISVLDDGLYVSGGGVAFECDQLEDCTLGNLGDVDVSTLPPGDGDSLVWNQGSGQWVSASVGTNLVTVDSSTINHTTTGSGTEFDPLVLSSTVIVDSATSNLLQATPSGLIVSCEDVQDCVGQAVEAGNGLIYNTLTNTIDLDCAYVAANCVPVVPGETPLVVTVNGDNTAVSQSGTNGHTVDINTLSNVPGNVLTTGIDGGLYLNCSTIDACTPSWDCSALNVCSLDSLGDVSTSSLAINDVLSWNGTTWVNESLPTLILDIDFVVTSTDCIELTLGGSGSSSDPWSLSADVVLDVDGGLICTADGIQIEVDPSSANAVEVSSAGVMVDVCGALENCSINDFGDVNVSAPTPSDLLVFNGDDWVNTSIENVLGLQVADTVSVDLTLSGTGSVSNPWILAADARIDPDGGLVEGPDGIQILIDSSCSSALTTSTNGLCLDLDSLNLEDLGNVSCVAPVLGHTLLWNGSGWICGPPQSVQIVSSDCLSVSGSGTSIDPFRVDPVLNPDACNALECTVDGLLVSNNNEFEMAICGELEIQVYDDVKRPVALESRIIAIAATLGTAANATVSANLLVNGSVVQVVTIPAGVTAPQLINGLSINLVPGDVVSIEVTQMGAPPAIGHNLTLTVGICY